MKSKLKLIILGVVFLLLSTNSLFAVEAYVSDIYKKIDQAFYSRNSNELNGVLSKNNDDRYYYLMEHHTVKKIRQLIIKEDYSFAMDAIEVVIDNNLDNDDAVEMYNVIYESYKVQQQREAKLAEELEAEKARIAKEKEEKREVVNKQYISAEKAEGGAVYVSGKESKSSSSKWKSSLGIVDLMLLVEPTNKINSVHYGIDVGFKYTYLMNVINFGVDATAAFNFLGFTSNPEDKLVPLLGEFAILPKVSFTGITPNLFVKAGFGALLTGKSTTAVLTNNVSETMFTPIIGLEMTKIPLGPINLDLGANWYAAHLLNKDLKMKFAMGVETNVEIPFAKFETLALNFNVGLKDKILMKESGMENRGSLIIAVGVENVIK